MQDGNKSKPSRIDEKEYKYIICNKITIDSSKKEKIMKELAALGISHEVLFPELENYINVIEKKYKTES